MWREFSRQLTERSLPACMNAKQRKSAELDELLSVDAAEAATFAGRPPAVRARWNAGSLPA